MATTTNYAFEKPTVGADQDTWGDSLNDNWDAIDGHVGLPHKVATKSAGYTLVVADRNKLIRGTSAFTLALPAVATAGDGFFFYVMGDGGAVTLDPDGSETIDGASTLVVADEETVAVFCDGTAWYAKALGGLSPTFTGLTINAATPVINFQDLSGDPFAALQYDGTDEIGFATDTVYINDKLAHIGDDNTSVRFPAADTFTVETGGSEALRVDSSQNVGIGTTSPGDPLHVYRSDGNAGVTIEEANGTPASRELLKLSNNGGSYITLENTDSGETWYFTFENAATGRMIINNTSSPTKGTIFDPDGGMTVQGPIYAESYTVATLPSAATAGGLIYVSDETGGPVMAFSDGTNWRRMTDRAVVS